MIYYSIKNISYSNFKYVPSDSMASFEFPSPNSAGSLMILDGPNGYGKTTLFDAIELLLTGEIKAFREDMKSRGKDNYSILANDPQKPMHFSADFQATNGTILHIERQLSFSSSGDISQLTINGNQSDTADLQSLLQFNQNLFDLGIYISQRESLSFLQNKYKARGQEVAELLDLSFIQDRINTLQSVKTYLSNMLQEKQSDYTQQQDTINSSISTLQQQIKTQYESELHPKYERLFSDAEYSFDKKDIDIDISFDSHINVVEHLKVFSKKFDGYQTELFNQLIDQLINWDKNDYFALYNHNLIKVLKNSTHKLNNLNLIQRFIYDLNQGRYPNNCSTFNKFGITTSLTDDLNSFTVQIQELEKQLGQREKALQKIIEARTNFISVYVAQHAESGLDKHVCPLCGTKLDDLLTAIKISEKELRVGENILQKRIYDLKQKRNDVANVIIAYFDKILKENQSLLQLQSELDRVKDFDITELKNSLKEIGITSFETTSQICSLEEFNESLQKLMKKLAQLRRPHIIDLSSQEMATFKRLYSKFYHGRGRPHTVEQFQHKIEYITYQYSQTNRKKLQELQQSLNSIKTKYEHICQFYEKKISTISLVLEKYKRAQTEFNQIIQQVLQLPIYIFSGKIIQNYPLGLGVYAEINNTKIIFKPQNKNDDVYNLLSAGQLNGLSLSVLLAVHSVYGKLSSLNVLLIDDPLQTIDEISAISLADLLTEQLQQGQLMVSTHEDQKAKLFQYKFHQSGYNVSFLNMQSIYLDQ